MAVSLENINPTVCPEHFDMSIYSNMPFESSEFSDSGQSNPPICEEFLNNLSTGQMPSREEFGGPYGFSILIDSSKKSWNYSLQMNKLYVKMGCYVPIQFRITQGEDIRGMRIRALLVFDVPDDYADPVIRCPVHMSTTNKSNQDYEQVQHVVRCCHSDALYETDMTSGRHSVSVPLKDPQAGTSCITLLYSLMCKSSCVGGMNRRNTSIIFTLEKNLQVLGRHVIKVRVCSCPKRDMGNELAQINDENNTDTPTKGKKRKMPEKVTTTVKPKVKEETPNLLGLQSMVPVPKNCEPIAYLEVRSKKHYYQTLQMAKELYQARASQNLAMYDNLLRKQ